MSEENSVKSKCFAVQRQIVLNIFLFFKNTFIFLTSYYIRLLALHFSAYSSHLKSVIHFQFNTGIRDF